VKIGEKKIGFCSIKPNTILKFFLNLMRLLVFRNKKKNNIFV